MPTPVYPFHSLEDFLTGTMSHVDGQLDDGGGASFAVKGREIDATVLFADIASFSTRTVDMIPVETLAFVNNFFAWITAAALRNRPGIVDKYIGDEVMVVFSTEFGSEEPFLDAVQAAVAMSRHDVHAYNAHIGIASGPVIVGYAGTALRYSASVFGAPVALAARCAGVRPTAEAIKAAGGVISSSIVFPEAEWVGKQIDDYLPPEVSGNGDGTTNTMPSTHEIQSARPVSMKGLGDVEVREILRTAAWFPMHSAEERARVGVDELRKHNRYWPRRVN